MFEKKRLRKKGQEIKRQHLEDLNPEETFFEELSAADKSEILMYERIHKQRSFVDLLESVVSTLAYIVVGTLAITGLLSLIYEDSREALIELISSLITRLGL